MVLHQRGGKAGLAGGRRDDDREDLGFADDEAGQGKARRRTAPSWAGDMADHQPVGEKALEFVGVPAPFEAGCMDRGERSGIVGPGDCDYGLRLPAEEGPGCSSPGNLAIVLWRGIGRLEISRAWRQILGIGQKAQPRDPDDIGRRTAVHDQSGRTRRLGFLEQERRGGAGHLNHGWAEHARGLA